MCLTWLWLAGSTAYAQDRSQATRRPADSTAALTSEQLFAGAWLMGMRGVVRPSSAAAMATLDAESNRIWERQRVASYLTFLHRRDRFVLTSDLSSVHTADPGRVPSGADAMIVQQIRALTVTPGYTWYKAERSAIAVLGGVRIWRMQNAVDVPSLSTRDETRTSYYDAVVAARIEHAFGRAIHAAVYVDAGGFAVASDLTWQLAATVRLRASPRWSLVGGVRHLDVDYRGDGKRLSLAMFGPTVGGAVHF